MAVSRRLVISILATLILWQCPAAAAQEKMTSEEERIQTIARDVRKQLVSLTQYGVFDHLWFGLQNGAVVLRGFASRPTLKSAAESATKRVKGVEEVKNEIEVLPLSSNDDRIRAGAYARIYGSPPLQKYTANRGGGRYVSRTQLVTGITNNPPMGFHSIRIIVKNGQVTLYVIVDNAADFAMAEMQAKMTPGSFAVFNELLEVQG